MGRLGLNVRLSISPAVPPRIDTAQIRVCAGAARHAGDHIPAQSMTCQTVGEAASDCQAADILSATPAQKDN